VLLGSRAGNGDKRQWDGRSSSPRRGSLIGVLLRPIPIEHEQGPMAYARAIDPTAQGPTEPWPINVDHM
jgi:hypothetical protein